MDSARRLRLRRIWVTGLPPSCASAFAEFMLFHGVDTVSTLRHSDGMLEVVFHYAGETS